MGPAGPQTKNDYAGEGRQKTTRPDHRNYYFDDEVAKQHECLARSFAGMSRAQRFQLYAIYMLTSFHNPHKTGTSHTKQWALHPGTQAYLFRSY
jgi:hypothetical protein